MNLLSLSATIQAQESNDDVDLSDWLNIAQDDIEPRFNSVTKQFLSTLSATVFSGGDPYSLLGFQCPVTRRIVSDGIVATYRAEIIVNRSPSLRGLYTIKSEAYEVSGPRTTTKIKSGEILTNGRKSIELGWLPISLTVAQEYPAVPIISWKQENGFLYLDTAEYAALFARGVAEVDIWTVIVDHKQGEDLPDSSIAVVAEWGAGNKVNGEHLIPGCATAMFRECPNNIINTDGTLPEGKKWDNASKNPPQKIPYIDGCTGNVIGHQHTITG